MGKKRLQAIGKGVIVQVQFENATEGGIIVPDKSAQAMKCKVYSIGDEVKRIKVGQAIVPFPNVMSNLKNKTGTIPGHEDLGTFCFMNEVEICAVVEED